MLNIRNIYTAHPSARAMSQNTANTKEQNTTQAIFNS
jgi:hypothetical protein